MGSATYGRGRVLPANRAYPNKLEVSILHPEADIVHV